MVSDLLNRSMRTEVLPCARWSRSLAQPLEKLSFAQKDIRGKTVSRWLLGRVTLFPLFCCPRGLGGHSKTCCCTNIHAFTTERALRSPKNHMILRFISLHEPNYYNPSVLVIEALS